MLDGYALDKNHTFAAYILSAMRDLQEPEENWTPPAKKDYVDAVSLYVAAIDLFFWFSG